jgi:hypothetical protein
LIEGEKELRASLLAATVQLGKDEIKVPSKLDAAAAIGLGTGMLYLWGWVYWAAYYHFFGLPFSFGTISFERLVMAGSWFLWLFVSWALLVVLLISLLFLLVRRMRRRIRGSILIGKLRRFARWPVVALLPLRRAIGYSLAVLMLCASYHLSLGYIRADAARDAMSRMDKPESAAALTGKDQKPFAAFGTTTFDLLDQRDSKIYLLAPGLAGMRPKVVIVPQSEVVSMTVQSIDRHPK